MSNVYARNRTESPLEVINKSELLLIEVYALIMNEKKVPKKHRYFIGKSMYDSANSIASYIYRANNIFPNSKEDLIKRREYQDAASYECSLFLNLLEIYTHMLPNISYNDIERIANIADSINTMISKWQVSDHKRFKQLLND